MPELPKDQDDQSLLRKQLHFRAWHRGTREMDLLLGSFADQYLPSMTLAELYQFADLLQENDPDLYNWVSGKTQPPANLLSDVLVCFLKHKFPT